MVELFLSVLVKKAGMDSQAEKEGLSHLKQ